MDQRLHWLETVRIARHSKVLKLRCHKFQNGKVYIFKDFCSGICESKITSNQALLGLQYDILFVDTNTTVLALFFIIVIRHEWGNILIF